MTKPVKKKILVSVWTHLIALLNKKVDKACLNRDAYLDHVLRHEANKLIPEIEIPNSPEARAHLSQHLALLERKPVSFTLSPETIAAIDTNCQAKNIPRDCFINRVLFMLVVDQISARSSSAWRNSRPPKCGRTYSTATGAFSMTICWMAASTSSTRW